MTSGTPKERWCNWKGETTDWAGPLPSLEMVSSGMVFASPDQLRFRDPKAFFPGNVHNNISLWQQIMPGGRPKSDEILKYLELGVDVTDFFTPLKGIFQGKFYDHPTPPQAWFPNSKSCIPFDNFVEGHDQARFPSPFRQESQVRSVKGGHPRQEVGRPQATSEVRGENQFLLPGYPGGSAVRKESIRRYL